MRLYSNQFFSQHYKDMDGMLRLLAQANIDISNDMVNMMKKDIKDSQKVILGCEFIVFEANGHGEEFDKHRKKLMNRDADIVIINGMKEHGNNEDVQGIGCAALGVLAMNMENTKKLMMRGAGEAIINAMSNDEMSMKVRENGCTALWYLLIPEDHREKFMMLGVIEIIITLRMKI